MLYLDHNATTPVLPEVADAVLDTMRRAWANPSSMHAHGQAARRLLVDARARVAAFLGCQVAELVFTSGATEANAMAVLGALALQAGSGRQRVLMSAVEHPGLLTLGRGLQARGVVVDLVPVRPDGTLDLARATALMGDDLAVVSVMGANNETGVLMPTLALAGLARAAGALLHVDATQLAGKAALCFADSGADLLSVSAHKLHGPKGVGALVVRKGLALPALLPGRQERNRRGGTENTPGIAGFAAACVLAGRTLAPDIARMAHLRDTLQQAMAAWPGVVVYGAGVPRLPNTLCLRFGELDAEQVLHRLERAGLVASSGAACTAAGSRPSHVLLAMGATPQQAKAGVRFSVGRDTGAAEIQRAIGTLQRVVAPLLHVHLAQALPA
jgi:cysteine desulfurase